MELSEEDLRDVEVVEEPKVEEGQKEKTIWTAPPTPIVKIRIKDEVSEVTFPQMSIVVFIFAILFYLWSNLWYQTQENV